MKITFELEQNDFLLHQLYIASVSPSIKKRRWMNRMLVPLFFSLIALYVYFQNGWSDVVIPLSLGLLWYVLYPIFDRRVFLKHYQLFIDENFKQKLNCKQSLEFFDDYIFSCESGNESKIVASSVIKIIELDQIILIQLNSGNSFILPKVKIENIECIKNYLKTWANGLNIEYKNEKNWKFK